MNTDENSIREQFSAAYDGGLNPDSEAAFERALIDQPELRRDFESFSVSIDSLRNAPLTEPSEEHFAAVMHAVASEHKARVTPLVWRWLGPIAAALLIGIALGIYWERRSPALDQLALGAGSNQSLAEQGPGKSDPTSGPVQIVEVPVEVFVPVPVEVVRYFAAPQGRILDSSQEDSSEAPADATTEAPSRPLIAVQIDTEPLARALVDLAQASNQALDSEPELASAERPQRNTAPGPGAPVIASREAGRVVLRERGSSTEVAIALVACLDHGDPDVVLAARERLSDLQAARPEQFRLPLPPVPPARRWWQKAEEPIAANAESIEVQRDQNWRSWARQQSL